MRNIEKQVKIYEEKAKELRARVLFGWVAGLFDGIRQKIEIPYPRRSKARA